MFNEKQLQLLNYEIDSIRIKTREKGNINLSYIEGHDVIETANKIFGHGNWSYTLSSLEQVSQEQNQNQNIVICYRAAVRVVAKDINHTKETIREDVGLGTGVAKTLADAHEASAKEAVTDALKRCFRTFGNQFGNSLYDKSKNHQTQPMQQQKRLPQQSQNSNNQERVNNSQMQQSYPPNNQPPTNNYHPQEYHSLYNLGLTIIEQGNSLVVIGDDIFTKKDSIRACGFRWDAKNKLWYKNIEQQAA
jgi:DNA repair and recombination protein RAD52